MVILPVSPDSPPWVFAAAKSILFLHIGGGSVGILSGAVALLARKGERLHRIAGTVFFVSMLIMSGIGAVVAPFLPQRLSSVTGVLTFYLVATAWMTVRRKEGRIGRFEIGALFVALGASAADVILALQGAHSTSGLIDGQPYQAGFVFGSIAAFAATLDLKVILHRGISGAQRIARHLWRMCFALFIAAFSLFLGQPQVFPKALRDSPILFLPEIAVAGLMLFWLFRVHLTNRFKPYAAPFPRASRGLVPVQRLNAREKAAGSEKPTR